MAPEQPGNLDMQHALATGARARSGVMCCGLNWSLAALLAELTRPRWLFFAMFAFLSSQGRFMSTFLSERGLTNAQARGTL